MGILANENAIGGGNYLIERSLRFQSASSQYLSRTFTTPTAQAKWTFSGWVKRGSLGTLQRLITSGTTGSDTTTFTAYFAATTDTFNLSGGTTIFRTSNQVFRDPSAWYHIIISVDTTQATEANKLIVYVNGTQITWATTNAITTCAFNSAQQAIIGNLSGNSQYFDGYMTEINFIDGQALTPSSFGETDALTGVWVAKKYTGTYGTNGFYLKFNDGTSTTTLGQDRSGNANNWTLTNFTRSAGTSDCWMYDVPSGNGSPSATQPSSNYCVLNPLDKGTSISCTNANLNVSLAAGSNYQIRGTVGVTSGKWYWECIVTSTQVLVGIATQASSLTTGSGGDAFSWSYYGANGQKFTGGVGAAYGATFTTNDVIGIAFDADAGTLTFYKNNVSQGTAYTGLTSGPYFPAWGNNGSSSSFNFGQRSFAYTPPSGFKALCTANLPAPTIAKGNEYMDAFIYTGDGNTTKTVTLPFAADFVWSKNRTTANDHVLIDTVRGGTSPVKALFSNTTGAELTTTGAWGGFGYPDSLSGTSYAVVKGTQATSYTNKLNDSYVNWLWKAGSSTVTNTSGSISSQVRANTTAGFSIVTYTGTGANATVGHGLGVAPKMIIFKSRNPSGAYDWLVYNANLTSNSYYLTLNTTNAQINGGAGFFNNTSPTSSVFSIGTTVGLNESAKNFVAYCFAEIAGFSKFGSYTGNGSTDGTFVYCGFRPKFVMVKCSSIGGTGYDWVIWDTSRCPNNLNNLILLPNSSGAETTASTTVIDVLSNGFKLRGLGIASNENSRTYIYMAFAESPFSLSNAA